MRDFDGRSSFGTWLTRIAINSALMNLRKKRASREIATDYSEEMAADGVRCEISDWRPNPERRYAQSEEESMLKKAIQGLRPALRAVVQIQMLDAGDGGSDRYLRGCNQRTIVPCQESASQVGDVESEKTTSIWQADSRFDRGEVARAERRNEHSSSINTIQSQEKGRRICRRN
jgi:hypothetical protein